MSVTSADTVQLVSEKKRNSLGPFSLRGKFGGIVYLCDIIFLDSDLVYPIYSIIKKEETPSLLIAMFDLIDFVVIVEK